MMIHVSRMLKKRSNFDYAGLATTNSLFACQAGSELTTGVYTCQKEQPGHLLTLLRNKLRVLRNHLRNLYDLLSPVTF